MSTKLTRVLVADADDAMRNMVRLTLGQDTFAVVEAQHTDAAVRTAATWDLDLAIVAHDLPDEGGLAVVRALRAQPETRKVRTILITEKAHRPDADELEAAGVDAVLSKPFGAFTLLKECDAHR